MAESLILESPPILDLGTIEKLRREVQLGRAILLLELEEAPNSSEEDRAQIKTMQRQMAFLNIVHEYLVRERILISAQ